LLVNHLTIRFFFVSIGKERMKIRLGGWKRKRYRKVPKFRYVVSVRGFGVSFDLSVSRLTSAGSAQADRFT
jgi:hypothetical protein